MRLFFETSSCSTFFVPSRVRTQNRFRLGSTRFKPRAEPQFRYGEPEIRAHLLP
jgi:hypothetical protein